METANGGFRDSLIGGIGGLQYDCYKPFYVSSAVASPEDIVGIDRIRKCLKPYQNTYNFAKNRKSIVSDVNVIVPNKVVEVTFADSSKQKTVCSLNDEFSLELAISICITKNLIGGTSNYNKAVDCGMKVYNKKLQKQTEDKKNEERIKAKKAKQALKRTERIARRKAKKKEQMIEIQKEAIIRAEREMHSSNILNK